jgi:hypothetical protein
MRLIFFGAVASIAGVSGNLMETNLEQLDVNFLADGLLPDNMLHEFPDESNMNTFDQMQEDSTMDTFSQLPEEPTIDPSDQLFDDPSGHWDSIGAPTIDDFNLPLDDIDIFGDVSTTSPGLEVSSLDDTSLQDNLIVANAASGSLPGPTSGCARFFGLACCTGEPSQSSESAMGALPMTDVSGCSGCMCSFPDVQKLVLTHIPR